MTHRKWIVGLMLLVVPAHAAEVVFENDPSLPLVRLAIAFKAGAVADPEGQSGMTNFMGEMLLRGTKTHSKKEIELALDQMGAKLDVDARTESITLRGAVLSSQLDNYLRLVKELIAEPTFPENEMTKLKAEIISDIQEQLGQDGTLGSRAFSRFLFQKHPYGKPVEGRIPDIRSLTRDQVLKHYQNIIQEPLLLVVGTGDAPEEKISKWTADVSKVLTTTQPKVADASNFGKVARPENAEHRRLLIVDKPDRTQTQINLGTVGVLLTDGNYFPLHLGNYALGGPSFSAVLMDEIRVKRGWSYGADSAFNFGLAPRMWRAHVYPANKDTPNALSYTIEILERIKKNGLTQEQFDFAKRSLVNSSGFMYDTPIKRVENTLLEKTLNLRTGFMKSYGEEIGKVTLTDTNAALKEFLKPDRLAIVVVGTAKDLKPALAKAAGLQESAVEVVPYDAE